MEERALPGPYAPVTRQRSFFQEVFLPDSNGIVSAAAVHEVLSTLGIILPVDEVEQALVEVTGGRSLSVHTFINTIEKAQKGLHPSKIVNSEKEKLLQIFRSIDVEHLGEITVRALHQRLKLFPEFEQLEEEWQTILAVADVQLTPESPFVEDGWIQYQGFVDTLLSNFPPAPPEQP